MPMTELEPAGIDANLNVERESVTETEGTDIDNKPAAHFIDTGLAEYEVPLPVVRLSWEVPKENVTVRETIGRGAFSQVAKGTITNLHGTSEITVVAVKMLKGNNFSCLYSEIMLAMENRSS